MKRQPLHHSSLLQVSIVRSSTALALLLCSALLAAGQDEIDPVADLGLDLDPTTATSQTTEARFTDDLLRDAKKYATGKGYRYNPIRAYELYKKAAETGRPLAVYQVARCLILGEGVKKDESKGLRILKDLAEVIIQAESFRYRRGLNPITKETFKSVSELRPSAIKIASFRAKDGASIEGPQVLSISESSLRMMHSTGISTFSWDELPAFVQSAIGYDKVSSLLETAIKGALKK